MVGGFVIKKFFFNSNLITLYYFIFTIILFIMNSDIIQKTLKNLNFLKSSLKKKNQNDSNNRRNILI